MADGRCKREKEEAPTMEEGAGELGHTDGGSGRTSTPRYQDITDTPERTWRVES